MNWFEGKDIFNFILYATGRIDSPGWLLTQEYHENENSVVWRPIVPNNAFLATIISLVSLCTLNYVALQSHSNPVRQSS